MRRLVESRISGHVGGSVLAGWLESTDEQRAGILEEKKVDSSLFGNGTERLLEGKEGRERSSDCGVRSTSRTVGEVRRARVQLMALSDLSFLE